MKFFLSLFFLGVCCLINAQEKKIKIDLRDYHSARITDVVASSKYPYFYSADESGKILAYNSETKRVVKTIRPASGIPVKNLRLTFNDEVLTVNQKFDFSDGSQDSIISIQISNQKELQKLQGDIEFIGNQENFLITQDTNPDKSLNIIDLYDQNFKKIDRYFVASLVTKATYDSISETIAMVEGRMGRQIKVSLQRANDYENKTTIDIPEGLEIQDLFFEEKTLFAITTNKQKENIEIYNLSNSAKFEKPVYGIEHYPGISLSIEQFDKEGIKTIVITAKGLSQIQPIILEKKASKFEEIKLNTENGASNSVYLKSTDELIFVENYNPNFFRSARFSVYDNQVQKITGVVPEDSTPFYSGIFLPQNNWLIFGNEFNKGILNDSGFENNLKYYDKGTFNNRFGNLSYNDYLEVNHRMVDMSFGEFKINKETGWRAFYGYEKKSEFDNVYGYYAYDLINDHIKILSTKNLDHRNIVDYNSTTDNLLLSKRDYQNNGHEDPQEFIILNAELVTQLHGTYKFGKFSKNGDYLLLISDQNEVIIKDLEAKKDIFSEVLKDGKYKIFTDGDQDFLVTNSYYEISAETCNQSSNAYIITNSNDVEVKVHDCVNLIDLATKGDVAVLVIENIGLVIGENIYKFPFSEFPEKVSLNEDASKLMVNFSNGKIKIYNLDGFETVLEMIHPDKDSHIFLNQDNFYFSNSDPEDHLVASTDNKWTPIKTLESEYFNPAKVLESLGEPNEEYLKLLNKALSLRQQNLYANTEVILEDTKMDKPKADIKSNLYVLSIGVSDYQQSDYNLTFADKDALDIAKIYGKLSEKDMEHYKRKFFGNRFVLKNSKSDNIGSINKYFGRYMSVLNLYPLTKDGTYWIEKSGENQYLWNFKTGAIHPVDLPSDVYLDIFAFEPILFSGEESFIVRSNTGNYYQYNFNSEEYKILKIPQSINDQPLSGSDLTFLKDNRWAHFSHETVENHTEIVITIGTFETEEIERQSFNSDVYKVGLDEEEKIDSTYLYLPDFRTLSSNAEHLLYSDSEGQVFYKNLNVRNELPLKVNIPKLESLEELTISEDGKKLSVIKSDGETNKILSYSLSGELLETNILGPEVKGLSYNDNNFYWISMKEPLVEEEFLNQDELIENNLPVSFTKTEVRHLVNEEASSTTIEEAIVNTFKNAKPEDQILLFIAGHGVLDKNSNYYYATHDMDFNDVAKNGLAFKKIIESLSQSKAKNKLLLMDTCHSGNTLDVDPNSNVSTSTEAGQRGSKSRSMKTEPDFKFSEVVSDVFDDFLSNSGITIVSASSGADVAYENETLGNGAFTSAYIGMLKDKLKAGGLIIDETKIKNPVELSQEDISELLKEVMLLTNGKQIPDLREINPNSKIKMW